MTANPEQVIVQLGASVTQSFSTHLARHRSFPEVEAEGESPRQAALRLAEKLAFALQGVPNGWHGDTVEQALADVRAFIEARRGT